MFYYIGYDYFFVGIAGYNPKDHFPKIKRWIENVRQECNPYYDEAHGLVNKLAGLANKQLQGKL